MFIESEIEKKLSKSFTPLYLVVENESHMHSVPANSETHFNVTLVTNGFNGMRKVARHQAVYKVLADELASEVHALALHLYTEEEWAQTENSPQSPQCLGGSKVDNN